MAIYTGHNEDSSGNLLLSIGNGMTATVETTSTASQAYTVGSYIFFDNKLCKTTSAIASGATLAIGTNLSQTSLGAEITSHLRSSDGKEFYFDVKDGQYGYYPSASKTASEFVPFGGTGLAIPDGMVLNVNATGASFTACPTTVNYGKACVIPGNLVTKVKATGDSGSSLRISFLDGDTITIQNLTANVTTNISGHDYVMANCIYTNASYTFTLA